MNLTNSEGSRLKSVVNIVVLSLALWGVSRRDINIKETSAFENFIMDTLAPLQRGVSSIHHKISSFFDHYFFNVEASKNNVELKTDIEELKKEIFNLEQIRSENKRLKDLLEFGREVDYKKVLAQVVAWDSSSDFRVIRINKGIKDGVRLQNTVITSSGVVGYIYRVTDHFADILTILDPSNRVDVLIDRTRSMGILEGFSSQKCILKYVTRTDPVKLNDVVITSGLGNIYPRGLKIGIVSKVERESYGITQDIEIQPTIDFSKLEEVAVLVSSEDLIKKKEWQALDAIDNDEDEDGSK